MTYYKNQKALAKGLITLIDDYWLEKIGEHAFIEGVKQIINKNQEKVFENGEYTSIVAQRLGKRRIELLNKILKQTGDGQ